MATREAKQGLAGSDANDGCAIRAIFFQGRVSRSRAVVWADLFSE